MFGSKCTQQAVSVQGNEASSVSSVIKTFLQQSKHHVFCHAKVFDGHFINTMVHDDNVSSMNTMVHDADVNSNAGSIESVKDFKASIAANEMNELLV